jgi:hypothetical protein
MAALENQISAADIATALDVEFLENFKGDVNQLVEVLGIFGTETMKAGAAMYQYKVTGKLADAEVAEGDVVPLSRYKVEKVPVGEMEVRPYRTSVTAQALQKGGYRNAILRVDDQLAKDIRGSLLADFFAFLKNGTLTAQGDTLQAAFAEADAVLQDELEGFNDHAERIVHFANRRDVAAYLGSAQITTQTAFGLDYVKDFLGFEHVLLTSKVPSGTVIATPADNIHVYGCDFGELAQSGLAYSVGDMGLVGVAHECSYERASAITNVLCGMSIIAEKQNYICTATIGTVAAEG